MKMSLRLLLSPPRQPQANCLNKKEEVGWF